MNEEELKILESLKEEIEIHVNNLVERGVRKANIEIELIWHIKKLLTNE